MDPWAMGADTGGPECYGRLQFDMWGPYPQRRRGERGQGQPPPFPNTAENKTESICGIVGGRAWPFPRGCVCLRRRPMGERRRGTEGQWYLRAPSSLRGAARDGGIPGTTVLCGGQGHSDRPRIQHKSGLQKSRRETEGYGYLRGPAACAAVGTAGAPWEVRREQGAESGHKWQRLSCSSRCVWRKISTTTSLLSFGGIGTEEGGKK